MRHLLMHPAFPDLVHASAAREIDDKAKVWTVMRGADGRLEERLDDRFRAMLSDDPTVDEIVHALITAAAEQDIAETRAW